LRGSTAPDILDSAHECRRLFAETWGTFLLVVVAAGAGVVAARSGGAGRYQKRVESPVTVIRGCSNIAQEIAAIRVKTVRLINAQIVRPASRRRLLS
jgi:glycerol uptake facilitator-like aquaporin